MLEAFFAEMEMHSTAKESEVASDGDSSDDEQKLQGNGRVSRDPRDPRNKVKRARNDNVSSLLNHILSAEIEKTRSMKENA